MGPPSFWQNCISSAFLLQGHILQDVGWGGGACQKREKHFQRLIECVIYVNGKHKFNKKTLICYTQQLIKVELELKVSSQQQIS